MQRNKKIGIVLILVVSFLILYMVSIDKGSYSSDLVNESYLNEIIELDCENEMVSSAKIMECTLKGINFITNVSAIHLKINAGDGISIIEIDKDSSWNGSSDGGIIDYYTDENKSGNFNIVQFNVMADNDNVELNTYIKISEIEIIDHNFDLYQINDVSLDVRVASSVATLKELSVSGINFTFNPNTTSYSLVSDNDEIVISGVATDDRAIINGLGTFILNYGSNNYDIEVVAEDGTIMIYKLNITRREKLDFSDNIIVDYDNKYLKFTRYQLKKNDILNEINTNGEVAILDNDNKVVVSDVYICTGYKVKIKLGDVEEIYTIIILGDTSGDGKVNSLDLVMLRKHIVEYINPITGVKEVMTGEYEEALDISNDGSINSLDLVRMRMKIVGLE